MPPIQFITKVTGLAGSGPTIIDFTVPTSGAKVGDSMLAVIMVDTGSGATPDPANLNGWTQLVLAIGASAWVMVLRREIAATDLSPLHVQLSPAPAWFQAVLLVYRDLSQDVPSSAFTDIAASTNFVCPSRTLVRYSDMFLGVVGVTNWAIGVDVAPPGGTTERHDSNDGNRELEVFELLPEAPGATGTKTATTGSNRNGIALSLGFGSNGVMDSARKPVFFDPPGAIGLPTVGV